MASRKCSLSPLSGLQINHIPLYRGLAKDEKLLVENQFHKSDYEPYLSTTIPMSCLENRVITWVISECTRQARAPDKRVHQTSECTRQASAPDKRVHHFCAPDHYQE